VKYGTCNNIYKRSIFSYFYFLYACYCKFKFGVNFLSVRPVPCKSAGKSDLKALYRNFCTFYCFFFDLDSIFIFLRALDSSVVQLFPGDSGLSVYNRLKNFGESFPICSYSFCLENTSYWMRFSRCCKNYFRIFFFASLSRRAVLAAIAHIIERKV